MKHTYNTRRSDRSSSYMKPESSPSLFSFSSRTQRCSDGNLKPLPIHPHPILSRHLVRLSPSFWVWALGPTQGRGCFSRTCCLTLRGQTCLYEFANSCAPDPRKLTSQFTNFSHLDTESHDSSRFGNDVTECLLHPRRLASATLSMIAGRFLATSARTGL